MSAENDPGMWKELLGYVWGLLLIPVAMVWRKVDGAVQKPEFEKHKENVRDDFRSLFKAAEADRALVRDGFEKLTEKMHDNHVTLLEKISERSKS